MPEISSERIAAWEELEMLVAEAMQDAPVTLHSDQREATPDNENCLTCNLRATLVRLESANREAHQ